MKNTNISKKRYIKKAHQLLQSEGIEALTIRRLGSELKCNTANLYRYFINVDELMTYASLKFLEAYLDEVSLCFDEINDSLELHFAVWNCFAKNSFQYPNIFDQLFFGPYSKNLDQIIKDYYNLFPAELSKFSALQKKIFLTGNFEERDMLMVEKCIESGYFSIADMQIINTMNTSLFKGFLKDILDKMRTGELVDYQTMQQNFMNALKLISYKFVIK